VCIFHEFGVVDVVVDVVVVDKYHSTYFTNYLFGWLGSGSRGGEKSAAENEPTPPQG
jgi:hypothetical protein